MITSLIKNLLQQVPTLSEPYYESIKSDGSVTFYKIRYLPLKSEDCHGHGAFFNIFGECVGSTCVDSRLFFYDDDGNLTDIIEWTHTWRDVDV
jgi:hypothetical protein